MPIRDIIGFKPLLKKKKKKKSISQLLARRGSVTSSCFPASPSHGLQPGGRGACLSGSLKFFLFISAWDCFTLVYSTATAREQGCPFCSRGNLCSQLGGQSHPCGQRPNIVTPRVRISQPRLERHIIIYGNKILIHFTVWDEVQIFLV